MLDRTLAAFKYRDFRVLWFGAFTSTVGNWMQQVAQSWLVFELTKSSLFLGLDYFCGQLPILLFTLIGGVVADRHDRRYVLLSSQVIQMTTAFTLGALSLRMSSTDWQSLTNFPNVVTVDCAHALTTYVAPGVRPLIVWYAAPVPAVSCTA